MNRYQEMYKQKLMVPEEAAKLIKDGDRVVVSLGNGLPPGIVNAMAKRVRDGELKDLVYHDALNIRSLDIVAPEVSSKITVKSSYVTPVNRQLIQKGLVEYVPLRFSDSDRLLVEHYQYNVVLQVVAPMDKHGFFSTGLNPDHAYSVGKQKGPHIVMLEVNENMPRTYGNNHYHISEVAAIVENNLPLTCLPKVPPTAQDEAIGHYIAEQIPDGACIQLGIGGVPNALGHFLEDKKNLSVHSEMLCDSCMDLYHKGVITSSEKTYMPGKWINTFCVGTQELYDFASENPMIEFWGAEFVNNPRIAALNDKLMAINTILEVDLAGQCASESIAFKQYTGLGGQMDFVNASWQSKGGKCFLACYSTYTDKEGNLQSRIVPTLNNFVSVPRADVQYIVTEYGIAFLFGKSVGARVKELIAIAHPDFRDRLTFEAKKLNFLF